MAIHLEANYSKKLGLPGFSSHQYMLTVKTEVSDPAQVGAESAKLYALLQSCVDRELQNPGFVPPAGNGDNGDNAAGRLASGNGNNREDWACSPKQRDLIVKIVAENNLDKTQVEALAQDRFGKSVKALNRLEASGLIDQLLTQVGGNGNGNQRRRFNGRTMANTR